jgi:hypothetical protein
VVELTNALVGGVIVILKIEARILRGLTSSTLKAPAKIIHNFGADPVETVAHHEHSGRMPYKKKCNSASIWSRKLSW